MDEWREIPGYTRYDASTIGNIRSRVNRKPRILKPFKIYSGYLLVRLTPDDGSRPRGRGLSVHRLVALTFLGESPLQVNHKNGDKTDNRLVNLEYVTQSQNQLHRFRVLKVASDKWTRPDASNIWLLRQAGYQIREIGSLLGLTHSMVHRVLSGQHWSVRESVNDDYMSLTQQGHHR